MYRHIGESNIVAIEFSVNKGLTTVPTPRSIEQRSMMAKENSFERSFGDFQKINRTNEFKIVPAIAKTIFTTLAAILLLM